MRTGLLSSHGFNSNRMIETDLGASRPIEEVLHKTWYSPEARVHGGLCLKKRGSSSR